MKLRTVVDNIKVEGMVSQIFDIGPDFYFVLKIGKLVVLTFLHFIFNIS